MGSITRASISTELNYTNKRSDLNKVSGWALIEVNINIVKCGPNSAGIL